MVELEVLDPIFSFVGVTFGAVGEKSFSDPTSDAEFYIRFASIGEKYLAKMTNIMQIRYIQYMPYESYGRFFLFSAELSTD